MIYEDPYRLKREAICEEKFEVNCINVITIFNDCVSKKVESGASAFFLLLALYREITLSQLYDDAQTGQWKSDVIYLEL